MADEGNDTPRRENDLEPEGGQEAAEGERISGSRVPPIDFTTFILSLSTQALIQLGEAPIAEGKAQADLMMACQTIDLLGLLEQKTKGNLTGEEERLLHQILFDLRMRYVSKTKQQGRG